MDERAGGFTIIVVQMSVLSLCLFRTHSGKSGTIRESNQALGVHMNVRRITRSTIYDKAPYAYAKASLSLCRLHMPHCWKFHVAVQRLRFTLFTYIFVIMLYAIMTFPDHTQLLVVLCCCFFATRTEIYLLTQEILQAHSNHNRGFITLQMLH